MSAPQRALQCEGTQPRAQHPADDRPLALEELPHVLAARAACDDRIPAVGALPARGLAARHRQLLAAVQHAAEDARDLLLDELPAHPDTELAGEPAHGALQAGGELAVTAHELEPAIDSRHGADDHEAPARPFRQSLQKRDRLRRVRGRGIQALARRAMIDVGAAARLRRTLVDHTAIEPYFIVGADTHAERRGLSVDREAPGPDPVLGLPAGGESGAGEHFLQPLRLAALFVHEGQSPRSRDAATSSWESPPSADNSSSPSSPCSSSSMASMASLASMASTESAAWPELPAVPSSNASSLGSVEDVGGTSECAMASAGAAALCPVGSADKPSCRLMSPTALSSASGGSSSRLFRPK